MNYTLFEYWNDTDLGEVLYQFGYHNKIYLNVEIEKPEYNITIEAEQNGDNVEITKFRKWEKVRKFEIFMQEDLVDAFSFMAIHDNIEVTLRTGEVLTVQKHTMKVEPNWEELGCLAKVNVSFVVDYVTAGSCQTNLDSGCLCADSSGDFVQILEYAHFMSGNDGDYQLGWTVENEAGMKYTAKLYQLSKIPGGAQHWNEVVVEQYSCYTNLDDSSVWIFDGQFWYLTPGYISNITQAGADLTITGWCMPGAFITVYLSTDAVPGPYPWTNKGNYTADQLQAGITFTIAPPVFASFYLHVWNNSCDYGNTWHIHYIF